MKKILPARVMKHHATKSTPSSETIALSSTRFDMVLKARRDEIEKILRDTTAREHYAPAIIADAPGIVTQTPSGSHGDIDAAASVLFVLPPICTLALTFDFPQDNAGSDANVRKIMIPEAALRRFAAQKKLTQASKPMDDVKIDDFLQAQHSIAARTPGKRVNQQTLANFTLLA